MAAPPIRFAPRSDFHAELKAEVEASLAEGGRDRHATFALHFKTAFLLVGLASVVSVALLVPLSWPGVVALGLVLGFFIAGIGFNIMHDANHGSYSRRPWVNKVLGATLDLLGGSSRLWRVKHNQVHHNWTNIEGVDDDIDVGFLGRMSPTQTWRRAHRFQHLYFWPLYGFLGIKWHWFDDFTRPPAARSVPARSAPGRRRLGAVDPGQGGLLHVGVRPAHRRHGRGQGHRLLRRGPALHGGHPRGGLPARALCRGRRVPPAVGRPGAGGLRPPSARLDGGLRRWQPPGHLVRRRPELPGRPPPLPDHQPRPLPPHRACPGAGGREAWRDVPPHPDAAGGHRVPLPLPQADGDPPRGARRRRGPHAACRRPLGRANPARP
ncbi:MAG: fatty acid desaturase [bacterium]